MALDDVILVTLRGLDELTAPFQQAEGAMQGVQDKTFSLGNAIVVLNQGIELMEKAWDAVVNVMSPFITSASESETALAKLNTVLQSTAQNGIGLTSQQLQYMASSLQSVTQYSDETAMSAEAMLLRFENINKDIFPETLKLTADLATSLGIDLTAAAKMVGMALDDPAQGIGRLNTAYRIFDDSQMETIKHMAEMGDVAGAQALIIDALRQKFGGAAEAIGNTFAGQVDIAKNHLDDLRELIGGPVISVLGDLLGYFNNVVFQNVIDAPFIQFLSRVNELLQNGAPLAQALGVTFAELGNTTSPLADTFHALGVAFLTFQTVLDQTKDPMDAFEAALARLASGDSPLAWLAQQIQEFISTGESAGWATAIGDLFNNILAALDLNTKIQNALDAMTNQMIIWTQSGGADRFTTTLGGVIRDAITFALNTLDQIVGKVDFTPFLNALSEALWAGIKSALAGIGNAFWDMMATQVFHDADQSAFWDGVKEGFSNFGSFLIKVLFPMTLGADLARAARNAFSEIGTEIQLGIQNGLMSIGMEWWVMWWDEHVVGPVKKFLGISSPSTLFAGIGGDIVTGLINGITSMADWAITKIKSWLADILAPFKDILNWLGIDTSGIFGASGGTTGSHNTGGTTTTGGTTSSVTGASNVTFNFYGTTYINGVPTDGSYDCPPNIVISGTSSQLVTNSL